MNVNDMTEQLIFICFAILAVYWIAASFSIKPDIGRQRFKAEWRMIVFAATIVALILYPSAAVYPFKFGAILFSHTLAIGIIADIITLCGLIVTLWARIMLSGNWSSGVVIKEKHELIEQGPYAYVRHPIYTGVLLMFLGAAVFYGYASGFLLFIIIFIGFFFKSRKEEELLSGHFGASYLQYKRRTKALIPFVF